MKKLFFLLLGALMISSSYALTYSVQVPVGTYECYIAGEMTDWEHKIMNKTDETHYTIDIPNAKIAHKYKYCSGPGWGYVEKDAKGVEIYNRSYSTSDVVESWAAVYTGSEKNQQLVFNVTVPKGVKCCYIKGGWDGWSAFKEMKKVDDTHYTVKILTNKKMKYLYYGGPGNGYMEMKATHDMPDERSYTSGDEVIRFQAFYDPAVPDAEITYSVTVPAGTEKCYISGGWDGWMQPQEMKKTDATHFTLTIRSNKALKYMYFSGPEMKYTETNPDKNFIFPRKYNTLDVVVSWSEMWQTAN